MLLPVLSAILGILAFLPFDFFWLLGFIFLVPLFIFFLKENRFWRLIGGSFIFRLIFASGVVYFIFEPLNWLSSILIFLGLPVFVYFVKKFLNRFNNSLILNSYFLILSLPFLWTIFDHFQARYSFMPTYLMASGNIFGSSPFLGLAGIGGLILLTFFAALINILVALIVINLKPERKPLSPKAILVVTVIITVIVQLLSYFQLQKNPVIYDNLKNSLKIAVVSTNEKFALKDLEEIKRELIGQKIDVLIFPEDAFNDSKNLSPKIFQDLAKELNTDLTAAFDTIQDGKKYNSTVLFNKGGEIVDIYNKNRLTFMGEYWPFKNWTPFYLKWFIRDNPEIQNYAVFKPQSQYSRGEKKLLAIERANNKETILFASLICLEIHYPGDLKEYKKMGAQFIINPTSNRWIDLGTKHFLYLTNNLRQIEAVWLKIPIISSGVKESAGIIKPDGTIDLVDYEERNKNYRVFTGEIKIK